LSTTHTLSFLRRWNRRIRRLAGGLLVLALCALGSAPWAEQLLNECIRESVQDALSELYPELEVRLRGAQRDLTRGLELRGLTLRDPRLDPRRGRVLSVEEVWLTCDATLPSLWRGDVQVREVLFRRPRLRLEQHPDGAWNVDALRPNLAETRVGNAFLSRLRQMVIEDGELVLDESGDPGNLPLVVRDLHATIRPVAGRGQASLGWDFQGTLSGDHFRRAEMVGEWRNNGSAWTVRGDVRDLQVAPELAERLPEPLARRLRPLAALRGRMQSTFDVQHAAATGTTYDVEGHFFDGWIRDAALPYALTDLRANLRLRNEEIQVSEATARLGSATFRLDLVRAGFQQDSPLQLRASTKRFPVDHRLPQVLPESMRELWDKFLPSGTANVDMTLTFDGKTYQPDILIEFPDLSFTFHKFPYRVHHATGTVHLHEGKLHTQLDLPINGQRVEMRGELVPTEHGPLGWVELQTLGPITLDEALLAALPEKPQETLRSLQPGGLFELTGRFERQDLASPEFHRDLELRIHQGTIRYEKFPLPIDRIQGTITFQDDGWSFNRLTGRNDSAFIVARGAWDPEAERGHHLELDMVCSDVPLHDGLREALNEETQRLWAQLRPRGTLDHLDISLRFHRDAEQLRVRLDGEKWAAEQNVEGRTLSIKPVWFPFHLENLTGRFEYQDGILTIRELRGDHGSTRLKRGEVVCSTNVDGHGQWVVECPVLDIDPLEITPELLEALPAPASQALGKLGIRGPLSVTGNLRFSGRNGNRAPPDALWNLSVDTENGELHCGVKLKNIRGGVALEGASGPGSPEVRAELFVDSLTFQNMRFTQVRGPLRVQDGYLLLGTTAGAEPNAAGLPRSVTARVYDGEVTLDGWLGVADDHRFDLLAHLSEADLARMASESSIAMARISGKAFANLRLAGQIGAAHSWRGSGSIRLFEADIYQLPLMVALLKLLKIQPPDATAFTQSDMEFRVEGDRLYFDRIALQGDAVSLIGNGDMDLQRNMKLDFGAVVGREDAQLPWLRPFALGAARSVLGIQVTGPLHQPLVTARPFPELNETLQQLFSEGMGDPTLPWAGWLGNRPPGSASRK
jgi:hypothetical protein